MSALPARYVCSIAGVSFVTGLAVASLIHRFLAFHRNPHIEDDQKDNAATGCLHHDDDDADEDANTLELVSSNKDKSVMQLSLKHVDRFLRWRCSLDLIEMGLFPDAQEITESMACLSAVESHLADITRLSDTSTTCIVVGDGSTPRTAALLAMRSKWRVLSVDPALQGLFDDELDPEPAQASLPREQRHKAMQKQLLMARQRRREQREALRKVKRLELHACGIEQVLVSLDAHKHLVLILPHAHVIPDIALNSTLISPGSPMPSISIVQLPCCKFIKHDKVCGLAPDLEYTDMSIATSRRVVRVWRDIGPAATSSHAFQTSKSAWTAPYRQDFKRM